MVHLLRAHPVSDTRELCETLQDQLHETVRQCIDQPSISAEQWAVARLPIQAGGLYLPHLPSLAVIARTAALATMPRASRTTKYRQNLLQDERAELFSRLRGFCHTEPSAVAGNLDDPPQGMSLRHLSRKLTQSRDSAAINAFWLRRQDLPRVFDTPGFATFLGTTRPGRLPTMDTVTGSIPCQAGGRPPCWTPSSDGDYSTAWDSPPQGQDRSAAAPPRGESLAMPSLMTSAATQDSATRAYTHGGMTKLETTLREWLDKQA